MSTDTAPTTSQLPEIIGPRLTVYHLMPYFLDPTVTEAYLCRLYQLTPEQVSAARAYAFRNADTVLEQHMKIEDRNVQGNPPELVEQMRRTHATFQRFRQWLAERQEREAQREKDPPSPFPSFREWLQQHPEESLEGL